MALGGRLLQSRRRDEHRWDRPGQHGEYASDRSGNGASSLARRRYGAELRARRRQARERALFANRAIDREAALVGLQQVIDERPLFAQLRRQGDVANRRMTDIADRGLGCLDWGGLLPSGADAVDGSNAQIPLVCRQPAEGQDCRWGSVLDDDEFVLVSDAEIDSGLHPLMALPETAECKYGKQQNSH